MGASIGMPDYEIKSGVSEATKKALELKSSAAFEWGATLQAGYMFDLGNDMGISLLLDAGYHRDVIVFHQTKNVNTSATTTKDKVFATTFVFDTIQIGILPKFNLRALNMAFGIGGGVKIPVAFSISGLTYPDSATNYERSGYLDSGMDSVVATVIPYIKITFDYSLPIDTKTSIFFGVYAGYDFNIKAKVEADDTKSIFQGQDYSELSFGAIDVGAQIGLKYSL